MYELEFVNTGSGQDAYSRPAKPALKSAGSTCERASEDRAPALATAGELPGGSFAGYRSLAIVRRLSFAGYRSLAIVRWLSFASERLPTS
jgi:hypothetical protein